MKDKKPHDSAYKYLFKNKRLLSYIMLLYDLISKKSRAGLLANIFPIVLYNGKDDWNIPLNVNELIDKNIPAKYVPSFEYYPIVEKDISDETLDKLSNLVAAVVYLEKQDEPEKLSDVLDKIVKFIQDEEIIDIRMFTNWLKKMFRSEIKPEEIEKIRDIQEAKSMLTQLAEKIEQKGIEKGRIETAKRMKEKGTDFEFISEITGLSIEEIEQL